jgi:hypothetical protein
LSVTVLAVVLLMVAASLVPGKVPPQFDGVDHKPLVTELLQVIVAA